MIVGCSPAIRRALEIAERYARTRLSILLLGPTGTGKEAFAQHIHRLSERAGPLVDVNCGALPRDMAESLLFGHKRGAFTGAIETTAGFVARADGGTLFLDELASLSLDGQAKLLRVLETARVPTVGADTERSVDLRVIAASQGTLLSAVEAGRFRADVLQRVAGVVIELPPLAERMEDVLPLAAHFASLDAKTLEDGVATVLSGHTWPGNVRELQFVMQRAACLMNNGTISAAAVAEAIELGMPARRSAASAITVDRLIVEARANGYSARRTAAALGLGRSAFFEKMRAAGLSLRGLRRSAKSGSSGGRSGLSDAGSGIRRA